MQATKLRRIRGLVPFGYPHLFKLSFDARHPQKMALAQLALSASAYSKEPVFEACLQRLVTGGGGGEVMCSGAGSGNNAF